MIIFIWEIFLDNQRVNEIDKLKMKNAGTSLIKLSKKLTKVRDVADDKPEFNNSFFSL